MQPPTKPELPHPDRRKNRSENPLTALLIMLESARQTGHMEALALADDGGVLIAGAGLSHTCEVLAALAPLTPNGLPANDTIPTRLEVMASTHIRRIRVDGIEVLLCARGRADGADETLGRVSESVRRILSPRDGGSAKPVP